MKLQVSLVERKVAGSSLEGDIAFSPTALKLNCFMCLFLLVVQLIIVSVADLHDW